MMSPPLSTEYPTAGGLISNRIANFPSEMPYPFTALYYKLFSFTCITYFFTSVPFLKVRDLPSNGRSPEF